MPLLAPVFFLYFSRRMQLGIRYRDTGSQGTWPTCRTTDSATLLGCWPANVPRPRARSACTSACTRAAEGATTGERTCCDTRQPVTVVSPRGFQGQPIRRLLIRSWLTRFSWPDPDNDSVFCSDLDTDSVFISSLAQFHWPDPDNDVHFWPSFWQCIFCLAHFS